MTKKPKYRKNAERIAKINLIIKFKVIDAIKFQKLRLFFQSYIYVGQESQRVQDFPEGETGQGVLRNSNP